MIYVIIDSQYESHQHKNHSGWWKTGHASGVILFISCIFGYTFSVTGQEQLTAKLGVTFLFNTALPFILMNESFNMNRKHFFNQVANGIIFGMLIVCV